MFESNLEPEGHRFDPHSRKIAQSVLLTHCDHLWVTAPAKCLKYKTMAENENSL